MSHRRATFAFTLAVAAGCTSRTFEAPAIRPAVTVRNVQTYHQNNKLDLLFMVDDSSSMDQMQAKLKEQLPLFMQTLQAAPGGLPDIHIAVVSSDMGVPSDAAIESCTRYGDQGMFRAAAQGGCQATTLAPGATFLSASGGIANFTGSISDVFQCIAVLGASGCGFENQLASIDRALGADGQGPAPAQNAGFLRDDAILAIVLLTNEDDCSAPSNTKVYSENGSPESLANPLGPISGGYRCNRYGHLCTDPQTGAKGVMPPLTPTPDATGNPPVLNLTECESNDTDSGMLTPVRKFITDIRALKPDPDHQILVAAIMAPPAPYAVTWAPAPKGSASSEQWPEVMHSCGAAAGVGDVNPAATDLVSDGSFGDPGVRITQFLNGFHDSVVASICAPSYASALTAIATRINQTFSPPCLTGRIARTAMGTPDCSVTDRFFDATDGTGSDEPVLSCDETGNRPPCWRLQAPPANSNCAGQVLVVDESPANQGADTLERSLECSVCAPGSTQPGCD
ncbi:MAG TPA: hypothetical protein VHH90_07020 [Polyangia bacterium]|nr:hypothetical protein [Polyangia bacterium]